MSQRQSSPKLSVIVPVYNRRAYLRSAVQSLLDEHFPGLEILVVDDASEDGSLDTVADLPVQRLRLDRRRGAAAARNFGLSKAQGEWTSFLDSDDLLAPGGLWARFHWLQEHPDRLVVGGAIAALIDAEGNPLGSPEKILYPPHWKAPPRITSAVPGTESDLFFPAWLGLFHRSVWQHSGGFDESLEVAHDREFLLRLLAWTEIDLIPFGVVYYRIHGENLSLRSAAPGALGGSRRGWAERVLVDRSHGLGLKPSP